MKTIQQESHIIWFIKRYIKYMKDKRNKEISDIVKKYTNSGEKLETLYWGKSTWKHTYQLISDNKKLERS